MLTFTGTVQVWQVIVLAALLGAVNAFDGPARQAFVVEMVGRGDLPNAIALNSLTFNAARVIGPAFGGILLATVGAAWCFFFNGLSFLAVIVSLLLIRVQVTPVSKETQSAWAQLKAGVSYAAHQHELRGLLMLALFFSTFGISYSTVLPAYIDRVLHAGPSVFGLITAASGVGAVVGRLPGGNLRRPRLPRPLALWRRPLLPDRAHPLCLHDELCPWRCFWPCCWAWAS